MEKDSVYGASHTKNLQFNGKLEFARVEMRYKECLQPALNNLSFVVEPSEKVAVVGRTGAGKSSLYQLLLGFRTANKGCVLIDGEDVSKIDLRLLRREMNVVLQHSFVVQTDSVRKNLDPRHEFSDQELKEALTKSAFYLNAENED